MIDELEKRHCLWDVFEKEYHNRERREAAYTELQEILKFSKNQIKSKMAGLRTQLGREVAKTNAWKLGQATREKYKSTCVFFEKLQFLRPVMQVGKTKDNLTQNSDDSTQSQYSDLDQESPSVLTSSESTPRTAKRARKAMNKENKSKQMLKPFAHQVFSVFQHL